MSISTSVGDRVELVRCNDRYTRLIAGEKGTVRFIDSTGTVHVDWDSGSQLGLCRDDGDAWKVLQVTERDLALVEYRSEVRETFRQMSDEALTYQDAHVVGGIDREELNREMNRRRQ